MMENGLFFPKSLNSFFDEFVTDRSANYIPAVNISETTEAYHLEFSAAGFKKEDFKIAVEKDVLTVSAEHKTESTSENKNYSRKEFSFGSFKRSFTLPENVNVDKVEAKYEDGVLNVNIPKKEAEKVSAVREISVS